MPYIPQEKRGVLDNIVEELRQALVGLELDYDDNNTEGNINYFITKLLVTIYGGGDASTSYQQINDAIGLLECVKAEYYRKVAAPYEDEKEKLNGPVVREVAVTAHDWESETKTDV